MKDKKLLKKLKSEIFEISFYVLFFEASFLVKFIKVDQRYVELFFIRRTFIKVFPTHKMWGK